MQQQLGSHHFESKAMSSNSLERVLLDLESMGSVKFGNFTLKCGATSPVYFDLRLMVSSPKLMKSATQLLQEVEAFFSMQSSLRALDCGGTQKKSGRTAV